MGGTVQVEEMMNVQSWGSLIQRIQQLVSLVTKITLLKMTVDLFQGYVGKEKEFQSCRLRLWRILSSVWDLRGCIRSQAAQKSRYAVWMLFWALSVSNGSAQLPSMLWNTSDCPPPLTSAVSQLLVRAFSLCTFQLLTPLLATYYLGLRFNLWKRKFDSSG